MMWPVTSLNQLMDSEAKRSLRHGTASPDSRGVRSSALVRVALAPGQPGGSAPDSKMSAPENRLPTGAMFRPRAKPGFGDGIES